MKELKTQRDVILAILAGYEIEVKDLIGGGWTTLECKSLWVNQLDSCTDKYRIKPTKPSIDWSQVHSRFKYLARDNSGGMYLFEEEPYREEYDWVNVGEGIYMSAFPFASLKKGTCDWAESLVQRPE